MSFLRADPTSLLTEGPMGCEGFASHPWHELLRRPLKGSPHHTPWAVCISGGPPLLPPPHPLFVSEGKQDPQEQYLAEARVE